MVALQGTWAPALQGAVYTLNYNTDRYTILIEAYARDLVLVYWAKRPY
jgi:hypothetical protein